MADHAHCNPAAHLDAALHTLRQHGHRITGPRRAMLELLLREHGPYTAEEMHQRLGAEECDLVTCYRSLAAMEEIGVLRRCDFGDGAQRYEFNHGDHHHHHIICRRCRHVHNLDFCVADGLERLARQMGYTNVSHTLEIFGVCPKCSAATAD